MKDLKKLKGAKQLSKMEQKVIKGGVMYIYCDYNDPCPFPFVCVAGNYCSWGDNT